MGLLWRAPPPPPAPLSAPLPLSSCDCFSICDLQSYLLFRESIPPTLDDPSSPWLPYLQTVYHEQSIRLPFNLTRLWLFYMPTSRWRTRNRGVEWPMALCRKQYNFKLLEAATNAPRCKVRTCARWLMARGTQKKPPPSLATISHAMMSAMNRSGFTNRSSSTNRSSTTRQKPLQGRYTVGAIGYPLKGHPSAEPADAIVGGVRKAPMAERLQTVTVQRGRSGLWAEVIRVRHGGEGAEDYGCWFYLAPGSGIWLRLGRAISNGHTLATSWLARHNMSWENATAVTNLSMADLRAALVTQVRYRELDAYFPPHIYHRVPFNKVPRFGGIELGPAMARDAGYDTWLKGGEVVALSHGCMKGGITNLSGGCVPRDVGLRTGQRANLPCHCDPQSNVLNCDAAPPTRLHPSPDERSTRWRADSHQI